MRASDPIPAHNTSESASIPPELQITYSFTTLQEAADMTYYVIILVVLCLVRVALYC